MLKIDFTNFFYGFNCKCSRDIVCALVSLFFPRCDVSTQGAKERMGCGNQREATAPLESLVKLQLWLLSLRWKTCLRQNCSLGSCACREEPALGQNSLMVMFRAWILMKSHLFFGVVRDDAY